jgi:Arc/MetJ-type ribon-helix-helix transcriptional regulator
MRNKNVVNCRLSPREIWEIDELVKAGYFRNRSDAIRSCVTEALYRIRSERAGGRDDSDRWRDY